MGLTGADFAVPSGRWTHVEYDSVKLEWIAIRPQGAGQARTLFFRAPTLLQATSQALDVAETDLPAEVREQIRELERVVRSGPQLRCPCCRHLTLFSAGRYEICPVCNWEDDPTDGWSGPNGCTLEAGRALYSAIGSSSRRALEQGRVRAPLTRES